MRTTLCLQEIKQIIWNSICSVLILQVCTTWLEGWRPFFQKISPQLVFWQMALPHLLDKVRSRDCEGYRIWFTSFSSKCSVIWMQSLHFYAPLLFYAHFHWIYLHVNSLAEAVIIEAKGGLQHRFSGWGFCNMRPVTRKLETIHHKHNPGSKTVVRLS